MDLILENIEKTPEMVKNLIFLFMNRNFVTFVRF